MKKLLCGPVEIPRFVLESMDFPSFSHRTPAYEQIQAKVEAQMQQVFGTKQDVFVVTSSGTGCMETAILNCFSPGDHVVVPIVGNFSQQFATMGKTFGLEIEEVLFDYGQSADVERVKNHITDKTKGVFLVHNESSSGVMNDLQAFGQMLKSTNAILVVDSVSGAGGLPLAMDDWGVDVLITASQKCLMAPAGLAFIALSDKAWGHYETSRFPKYYFDLKRFRQFNEVHQTPTTPGIYTLLAVSAALDYLEKEGFANVVARTKANAELLRAGLADLGFKLIVKDGATPSDTLSTVSVPEKADYWRQALKDKGYLVAGGLAPYKADTFRIGTMGYVFEDDIRGLLQALKEVIDEGIS